MPVDYSCDTQEKTVSRSWAGGPGASVGQAAREAGNPVDFPIESDIIELKFQCFMALTVARRDVICR